MKRLLQWSREEEWPPELGAGQDGGREKQGDLGKTRDRKSTGLGDEVDGDLEVEATE